MVLADAEARADRLLRCPVFHQIADLANFGVAQARRVAHFAEYHRRFGATFFGAIPVIVASRTLKQMGRIHAGWVVAAVQDAGVRLPPSRK